MAITQNEIQGIVNSVLSAIRTNSRTIDQLTPVAGLSDNDSFEIGGGKRVTYSVLKALLTLIMTEKIDVVNQNISTQASALSQLQSSLTSLKTAFDALVGGNASTAIDNFNEVIAFLEGFKDSDTLAAKLTEHRTRMNGMDSRIASLFRRIVDFDGIVDSPSDLPSTQGVYWVKSLGGFRDDVGTSTFQGWEAYNLDADPGEGRVGCFFRYDNDLYFVNTYTSGCLARLCGEDELASLQNAIDSVSFVLNTFSDSTKKRLNALESRIVDFSGIVATEDDVPGNSSDSVYWVSEYKGFRCSQAPDDPTLQQLQDYNLPNNRGRRDRLFRCGNLLHLVNSKGNLVSVGTQDDIAALQSLITSLTSRVVSLESRLHPVPFKGIASAADDVPGSPAGIDVWWADDLGAFIYTGGHNDPGEQGLEDYNDLTTEKGRTDRIFSLGSVLYRVINGSLVAFAMQDAIDSIEDRIGSPGGIAELDNAGLVPRSQLPGAVVEFAGFAPAGAEVTVGSASDGFPVFNAATNRFICPDGSGVKPKYYCNWADGDLYGTASATGRIPLQGILYADNASGITYRWDGEAFIPAASHTTPGQLNAAAKQLFIWQWNLAAGEYGSYNEETGYFELYGITDISFHEALEIYLRYRYIYKTRDQLPVDSENLKTLLPIYGLLNLSVGINEAFMGLKATELAFRCNVGTCPFETGNAYRAFFMCHKLEVIHGSIELSKTANAESMFGDCPALREVRIYNLCKSLYLASSPNISLATLQCLVWNAANTTAITVTVHPAVFAKLNPPEGASEEALQWAQLVEDAAAKNITFAIP